MSADPNFYETNRNLQDELDTYTTVYILLRRAGGKSEDAFRHVMVQPQDSFYHLTCVILAGDGDPGEYCVKLVASVAPKGTGRQPEAASCLSEELLGRASLATSEVVGLPAGDVFFAVLPR